MHPTNYTMASKNVIDVKADDGTVILIRLSFMDRIKRMLFSKQEWVSVNRR